MQGIGEHKVFHHNLHKYEEMTRSIKKQMSSQKIQQKMQSQELKMQSEQILKRPTQKERSCRKISGKERMRSLQVNDKRCSESSNDNRPMDSSSFGPSGS